MKHTLNLYTTVLLDEQLVPSPEQVQIALWPAFGVAVFVLISLFFCYLPSYMRIVIELRCGIVPSLTSELFTPYRAAVDSVRYSCLSCCFRAVYVLTAECISFNLTMLNLIS